MAALNFANETEADKFYEVVNEKLEARRQKKLERRMQHQQQFAQQSPENEYASTQIIQAANGYHTNGSTNSAPGFGSYLGPINNAVYAQPTKTGVSPMLKTDGKFGMGKQAEKQKKKKKKDKKNKLTKEDIGLPTNFQHLQHVGWDPVSGFDVNVDDTMRDFFKLAGVSQSDLQDESTRTYIYQFIEQHGGLKAVENEIKTIQTTSPPPPIPPEPPVGNLKYQNSPSSHHPTPPPPPARHNQRSTHKPSAAPPPPPPPPPPPVDSGLSPPPCAPPPPPPPPPPVDFASSPPSRAPSKPSVPQAPPVVDVRSALLEDIKRGKALHHVDRNMEESRKSQSHSTNGRDALLEEIRKGAELKHVETNSSKPATEGPPQSGLAAALARALQERSRAINRTDESSDADSDSDAEDEWD